jgi:hypothetical protein
MSIQLHDNYWYTTDSRIIENNSTESSNTLKIEMNTSGISSDFDDFLSNLLTSYLVKDAAKQMKGHLTLSQFQSPKDIYIPIEKHSFDPMEYIKKITKNAKKIKDYDKQPTLFDGFWNDLDDGLDPLEYHPHGDVPFPKKETDFEEIAKNWYNPSEEDSPF